MHLKIPQRDWTALIKKGSGGSMIRAGIDACRNHPDIIGEAVKLSLRERLEPAESRGEHKTTALLEFEDVKFVDEIAAKLEFSRLAVLNLIVKAVLYGLVRPAGPAPRRRIGPHGPD